MIKCFIEPTWIKLSWKLFLSANLWLVFVSLSSFLTLSESKIQIHWGKYINKWSDDHHNRKQIVFSRTPQFGWKLSCPFRSLALSTQDSNKWRTKFIMNFYVFRHLLLTQSLLETIFLSVSVEAFSSLFHSRSKHISFCWSFILCLTDTHFAVIWSYCWRATSMLELVTWNLVG